MTINLQSTLVKQLESLAAEQTTSTEEVLEAAVRAYLREIDRKKIKAEVAAYTALHPTLIKHYLGQHVAIHHGQAVDHDPDFQALHLRIRQRFGRQPVLIRRVEAQVQRELVFRGTHALRNRIVDDPSRSFVILQGSAVCNSTANRSLQG
jgi:hypothetical protein